MNPITGKIKISSYSFILGSFLFAHLSLAKVPPKPSITELKSTELNFESIKNFLIANPEIDSVNKFIKSLPASFRDGFSVLTESRGGIPGVTPENPRIIIHGQNRENERLKVEPVNLILAVNKGSNTVEIIEFTGEKFVPHKIEFSQKTGRSSAKAKLPKFDLHLGACMSCHSAKKKKNSKELEERAQRELVEWAFRPNWESYPRWRGPIGSFHRAVPSRAEQSNLENLRERAPQDEWLSLFEFSQYVENFSQDNLLFTTHLTRMNSRRVWARLQAEPNFEEGKLALFAALLGDENWFEFLPEWQKGTEQRRMQIEKKMRSRASKNRNRTQKALRAYYKNLQSHLEASGQILTAPSDFGLSKDHLEATVGLLTYADLVFKNSSEVTDHWPLIFKGYTKDVAHEYADGLSGMNYLLKQLIVFPLLESVMGLKEIWNSGWTRPYNHPAPEKILSFLHKRLEAGEAVPCRELFKKGS